MKKFKAVIVDTETTGLLLPSAVPLDQQPRIIELGIAIVLNGKVRSEYNTLINPRCAIPELITNITGIDDAKVENAPVFNAIFPDIVRLFKGADFFIAHNAVFDKGMLSNEIARINKLDEFVWPREIICSVQEYTPLFGRRPKLIELYEHLLGKPLAQTHRALDDVHALLECLMHDNFFERIAA